ncbi:MULTISPECIES: peroxiredoxin [unclassified Wenzhouxiangella]|uniref:peroxiredoxin n=1 Tax=unclassified Wenzhouxiangella TaxID=2613841 RepID=UPI000E32CE29|nr:MULTISPECIES: peroxiredoxin [unclassified Wenzhouxiangella]RFF28335.1 peroxiredoxin [Wenzhouxiangella sp. 15181]RFP67798.1 peroxiredoxin [Wenzhouxiangella sp. 15190]
MTIRTGDAAPDFSLRDQDDGLFTLAEHLGKRLLLVFYPGDDTPVCTRQLCDYRDGIEQFADLDVEVVGISGDDAASHRRFRDKHELPFTLLSDPDLAVAEAYGCKSLLGMKRGVFLVDEHGVVRYAHVESVAMFRRSRDELIEVIRHLE